MTLIFLHIAKASGSTLHYIFDWKFKNREIYTIEGAKHRLKPSIDYFKNLNSFEKEKIKVLKGHMPFGLHKYIDSRAKYVTILRNPIDRIVSEYYYICRNPKHYLYNTVNSNNMSLKDFVSKGISTELNNGQTRLLAGDFAGVDNKIPFGKCKPSMLEMAKNNLKKYFLLAGVSEKFDETLILMMELLNWRFFPFYIKMNVTKKRHALKNIDENSLKEIIKHNKLDIELYRFVKANLDYKIEKEGPDFSNKVILFKKYNNFYQKFGFVLKNALRIRKLINM